MFLFLFDIAQPPAPPAPAAPAAPPAGTPSAPAAPPASGAPAQPEEPKPNPVQRALDAARAALTGGKGLGTLASEREASRQAAAVAPPAPAAPEAPKGPHHSQTQDRAPDGKFVDPDASPDGGGAPPEAGADPGAPPADADADPNQPDPSLVVTLPVVRRDGDEPLSIVLEDQADADLLRHNLKLAERAERLIAQQQNVQAEREEVESFRTQMAVDPVGFLLSEDAGVSPEQRVNLALTILTDENVWPRAAKVLGDILKNPQALATLRAEAKAERLELSQEAETRITEQRALQRNARAITTLVERLTPADFNETQASLFYRDCINDVKQYVNEVLRPRGHKTLDPRYLPQVLQHRLAFYGIKAEDVQAAMKGSARPTAAPPAPAARGNAAPQKGNPPAAPAAPRQPTGAELRKGAERRKEAAAAAPAGAGAPGTGVQAPPKGSTLKQAFKFARDAFSTRPS